METGLRFLCFGDSLTAGWPGYFPAVNGYSLGNGNIQSQYEYWLKIFCSDYLEKEHGISLKLTSKKLQFINKGIPGDTSSGLLHRKHELIEHWPKPDYSIIIIGTNDLGWAQSREKILENIEIIHKLSRENEIMSLGGLIPPITKSASYDNWDKIKLEFNDSLRKIFSINMIPFTEYTMMVDKDGYLLKEYTSGDGVHFSVEGYKHMGLSLFEEVIKSILEKELNRFK